MKSRYLENRKSSHAGFTLIELTIVIFIIGIISAIAFPQILPAIVFSRLEGEARHLAAYGRQVLAEATMRRERHVVMIDLDNQEYYVVRWEVQAGSVDDEEESDELARFNQFRRASGLGRNELMESLNAGRLGAQGGQLTGLGHEYDDELANQQMTDRFALFARQATLDRAKNVEIEGGILDEIGPLFGEEDQFRLDDSLEPIAVEVDLPTLGHVRLRNEVRLSQVIVDGLSFSDGLVELEVTSLGFMEKTAFYLQDEDDRFYTVVWDPVLATTRFYDGWRDIE
jgi:prepilin-type N-terminal cleavage/methylation domain-containing protein